MTNKFLKPKKRYMSLHMACSKLEVTEEDFRKISMALEVLPVISKARHRLDHVEGNSLYYRIEEIENIKESYFFKCIKQAEILEQKRKTYKELPRYKKDIVIDYRKVISEQYHTFEEAIKNLPFSIKLVYVKKRIAEFEKQDICTENSILCESESVIFDFYNLIANNSLLRKCFIGREGFYFSFEFINCNIEWFVPFKFEKKIENKITDFLYPKCIKHIKVVTEHMEDYFSENKFDTFYARKFIFGGAKFFIESERYREIYKLIIESCGGTVSSESYKYAVLDREVDVILDEVIYIQPQFIFDAFNLGRIPDTKNYRIGKKQPEQISSFKEKKKLLISQEELFTLSRGEKDSYFRKEYI